MKTEDGIPRMPMAIGYAIEWLSFNELCALERSHLDALRRTLRHRREWQSGTAEYGILGRECRYHVHRCHVIRRKERELMAEIMQKSRIESGEQTCAEVK